MQRFNDAFDRGIIIVPALAFVASVLMYVNRMLAIVLAGLMVAVALGAVAYGLGLVIQKFTK